MPYPLPRAFSLWLASKDLDEEPVVETRHLVSTPEIRTLADVLAGGDPLLHNGSVETPRANATSKPESR